MTTVRFGVVGTSAITEWFIKAGKKLDGFEIKATGPAGMSGRNARKGEGTLKASPIRSTADWTDMSGSG